MIYWDPGKKSHGLIPSNSELISLYITSMALSLLYVGSEQENNYHCLHFDETRAFRKLEPLNRGRGKSRMNPINNGIIHVPEPVNEPQFDYPFMQAE